MTQTSPTTATEQTLPHAVHHGCAAIDGRRSSRPKNLDPGNRSIASSPPSGLCFRNDDSFTFLICPAFALALLSEEVNWQPPNSHHLQAAEGWLELGNWHESNEELEQIAPELRSHPDVLKLRVEIYAAAKQWEQSATVAEGLIQIISDDPFPYVRCAFALHVLERTQEAYNVLLPVAEKFPGEWVIPYNLACYCAQLGEIEESEKWFKLAMSRDLEAVRIGSIDDPDLEPLWKAKGETKWRRVDWLNSSSL